MLWGLLIPIEVYETFGITEHQYHNIALIGGIPAGLATTIGILILTYRRLSVKRLIATSSKGDWGVLFFLAVVILSGMSATFFNVDNNGFDYRTTIGPWLRGILTFRPDASLLETVPIWFKIHMLAALGLFSGHRRLHALFTFSVYHYAISLEAMLFIVNVSQSRKKYKINCFLKRKETLLFPFFLILPMNNEFMLSVLNLPFYLILLIDESFFLAFSSTLNASLIWTRSNPLHLFFIASPILKTHL